VTEDQDHDAGQPASQRAALAAGTMPQITAEAAGRFSTRRARPHALRDQLERVRMRNERLRELEECPELRREVVTLADIAAWRNG